MKGLRRISKRTSERKAKRSSDGAQVGRYMYNERRLVMMGLLLTTIVLISTTVNTAVYRNLDEWIMTLSETGTLMYDSLPTTSSLVSQNFLASVGRGRGGGGPKVTVDIISVGSKTRSEHLRAQREAFYLLSNKRNTSQSSTTDWELRNFLPYTEDDDSETHCHTNLTKEQVKKISLHCRGPKTGTFSWKMRHFHWHFGTPNWLEKKGDGMIGWMCAQKRLPESFAVGLNRYKNNISDLPDYLILTDDDTYVNLPAMIPALQGRHAPDEGYSIAGCLVASDVHSFPYGGFGTVLTRKASERLLHPLHCDFHNATKHMNQTSDLFLNLTEIKDRDLFDDEFEALACNRIKDNLIGERDVYKTGISLADMLELYLRRWNYTSVETWGTVGSGLCLHSDWIVGYWLNSFFVSRHYGKSDVSHKHDDRIYPYFGSDMGRPDPNAPFGIQCNNDKVCRSGDHVCHHLSPDQILSMAQNHTRTWQGD